MFVLSSCDAIPESVWPSIIVVHCTIEVSFLLPDVFGSELSVHGDDLTHSSAMYFIERFQDVFRQILALFTSQGLEHHVSLLTASRLSSSSSLFISSALFKIQGIILNTMEYSGTSLPCTLSYIEFKSFSLEYTCSVTYYRLSRNPDISN